MDSTIAQSRVGMPIDIFVARRDVCKAELSYRSIRENLVSDLSERWSAALRRP